MHHPYNSEYQYHEYNGQKYVDNYPRYQRKRSHELYDNPKLVTFKCTGCGRERTMEKRLVTLDFDNRTYYPNGRAFCNENCRDKWFREHIKCRMCGKPIGDIPSVRGGMACWATQFCSKECSTEYRIKYHHKNAPIK